MSENSIVQDFANNYADEYSEHEVYLPVSNCSVYYRPMKTAEQKSIVKSIESEKPKLIYKTLSEVCENIITDWGELNRDINDMYLMDRRYLLLSARAKSKSNIIEFEAKCPKRKCEYTQDIQLDLEELEIKNLPEDLLEDDISLIDGKYQIKLTPPKRKDEIKKDKFVSSNSMQSTTMTEESYFVLALFMDSISKDDEMEKLDFEVKVDILDNLLGKDKQKIQDYVDKVTDHGFPSTIEFECESCGYTDEVPIDTTDFFLG